MRSESKFCAKYVTVSKSLLLHTTVYVRVGDSCVKLGAACYARALSLSAGYSMCV